MNTISLTDLELFGSRPDQSAIAAMGLAKADEGDHTAGRLGDWHGVFAGCAFAQACCDAGNAAATPEPHWYALAGILSRCEGGLAIFHKISSQDPQRYDPAEADAKFAQARDASPPRTCRSIREDLGFDGCGRCPLWRHA